jgi:hypothetical protein
MKYVDPNAFDLIAGVFYSRILPLKMLFDTRLPYCSFALQTFSFSQYDRMDATSHNATSREFALYACNLRVICC